MSRIASQIAKTARKTVSKKPPVKPMRQLGREVGGNKVRNYFCSESTLKALFQDVESATRKIQVETFLLSGQYGKALTDRLIAKKKANPDLVVQVLLDGKLRKLDRQRLAEQMKEAGIEVLDYNTKGLKNSLIAVDHAKMTIVDDKIAWVGGMNFSIENNRDMMTRIEGPSVRRIQKTFHEGWHHSGGRIAKIEGKLQPAGDVFIGLAQTGPRERTAREQVLRELKTLGKGDGLNLWMMDLGDPKVLTAIEQAVDRGAEVKVLLGQKFPFANGGIGEKVIQPLFEGFPDIYGVRRLRDKGVDVRLYTPPEGVAKLHGKVWHFVRKQGTAEESHRIIGGSVNALKGAYEFNREFGFVMSGGDSWKDFVKVFQHDFEQQARKIEKLSFFQRMKAGVMGALNATIV